MQTDAVAVAAGVGVGVGVVALAVATEEALHNFSRWCRPIMNPFGVSVFVHRFSSFSCLGLSFFFNRFHVVSLFLNRFVLRRHFPFPFLGLQAFS